MAKFLLRAGVGIVVMSLATCGMIWQLALFDTYAVLRARLDISSGEVQVHQFGFRDWGWYYVDYEISLRHGSGSSPGSHDLAGVISIYDADNVLRLDRAFAAIVGPSQVGGSLIGFKKSSVAGREPHTISLTLEPPSAEFLDRYTDFNLVLRREYPMFPLFY
jgi:hypothetical protein